MNQILFLYISLLFCIHITIFPLLVSIEGRDGVIVRRIFWSSIWGESMKQSTQGQRLHQMHLTETLLLSVYAFIILCYVKTITAISFTSAFSPLV